MNKDEYRKLFAAATPQPPSPSENIEEIDDVQSGNVYFKIDNYSSRVADRIKEIYGVNEALARLTYDSLVKSYLQSKTWAKHQNFVNSIDNFDVKVLYEVAFSNKTPFATRHIALLSLADKTNSYVNSLVIVVLYISEHGLEISQSDVNNSITINVKSCVDFINRTVDAYGITHFKKSYSANE